MYVKWGYVTIWPGNVKISGGKISRAELKRYHVSEWNARRLARRSNKSIGISI